MKLFLHGNLEWLLHYQMTLITQHKGIKSYPSFFGVCFLVVPNYQLIRVYVKTFILLRYS